MSDQPIEPTHLPMESTAGDANITVPGPSVHSTGATRANFSFRHLMSAQHFSVQVEKLEHDNQGAAFGSFFEDILANASASVLLSVAGLEAFANELFIDHERFLPNADGVRLENFWSDYRKRAGIVEKVNLALLLAPRPPLTWGAAPFQDVQLLIKLRNHLVHFQAEWPSDDGDHAKLSRNLASRFTATPFIPAQESLFPLGWASHACTTWGLRSVCDLIRAVEQSLGVPSMVEKHASKLGHGVTKEGGV